ncbi:heterochromatin protein 1-binding protein 3 isoform X2 [Limanda limanda]|uniref:heterochromatin protein 1-binding protein 3 isoform X2 n=1 Tax=Limanda limanda TaxID=27771 RepID=UPI0029C61679|nr:heterochromatin protein 1-binding protein 3 isoform X2 [Limanda limanda]
MPIRRAAATPTQEKAPAAAAEKEPEASEESPSPEEEPAASSAAAAETKEGESEEAAAETTAAGEAEPTENGEQKSDDAAAEEEKEGKSPEKKELKDGYKYEKAKVKKVKRKIPAWASVASSKKLPVTNFAGTQNKVDNILIEAIASCNDKTGVSYQSVMKFIGKKYPDMELDRKKFLIKKAMKKHLEKGTIKQLKGNGLSGTFAMGKQTASSKKSVQKLESLGDALPLIITRLCEPKEASYILIRKYLERHFPNFNIEKRPDVLKTALLKAVEKGQLEQITGKGASGTFQLKRTGNQVLLKGSTLEDAITAAITAMNEPKTCSTFTLRKFLVDTYKDKKEHVLVSTLRRTLTKCKVLGWMEQITGQGLMGTYQLSFPFYPSPTILYPDKFLQEPEKKIAATPTKRRRTADSSDEEEESSEEEEEEEDDDEDDEPPPRKRKSQKRPPPKVRRPPPAKKSQSSSQSKAKGRGRSLAKKSPAKKVVKTLAKKETTTPSKAATPVKRGAPARKPKTPVVKKLSKRATKLPVSRESSPEEAVVPKETTRVSRRSKAEESTPVKPTPAKPTPVKPAAKKAATKGGSKRPEPEEPSPKAPAAKKGAKVVKKTTRKSKRGRN